MSSRIGLRPDGRRAERDTQERQRLAGRVDQRRSDPTGLTAHIRHQPRVRYQTRFVENHRVRSMLRILVPAERCFPILGRCCVLATPSSRSGGTFRVKHTPTHTTNRWIQAKRVGGRSARGRCRSGIPRCTCHREPSCWACSQMVVAGESLLQSGGNEPGVHLALAFDGNLAAGFNRKALAKVFPHGLRDLDTPGCSA